MKVVRDVQHTATSYLARRTIPDLTGSMLLMSIKSRLLLTTAQPACHTVIQHESQTVHPIRVRQALRSAIEQS